MAKLVVGGYHYTYTDLVFIVPDINFQCCPSMDAYPSQKFSGSYTVITGFWGSQLPYMAPWVGFKSHAAIVQRLLDHQSPKSTIGGVTM